MKPEQHQLVVPQLSLSAEVKYEWRFVIALRFSFFPSVFVRGVSRLDTGDCFVSTRCEAISAELWCLMSGYLVHLLAQSCKSTCTCKARQRGQ